MLFKSADSNISSRPQFRLKYFFVDVERGPLQKFTLSPHYLSTYKTQTGPSTRQDPYPSLQNKYLDSEDPVRCTLGNTIH